MPRIYFNIYNHKWIVEFQGNRWSFDYEEEAEACYENCERRMEKRNAPTNN